MPISEKRAAPPKSAKWLLAHLQRGELRQGVVGDLEEFYQEMVRQEGFGKARKWYYGQVLRSIWPAMTSITYWSFAMLSNYLKLAVRNLARNKLSSFINLFGLAAAIGCSIVSFSFIHFTYNQDSFHENAESIFVVENDIDIFGSQNRWSLTPVPLAPALKADYPQVKYAVRVDQDGGLVRSENIAFTEQLTFVDPDFLEMFTFPLLRGTKRALDSDNAVVLSYDTAEKYFGRDNPLGKQVTVSTEGGASEVFMVAGVTLPFPRNASFRFDVLLPYQQRERFGFNRFDDWSAFTRATFIQLDHAEEITSISADMHRFIARQNDAREDWLIRSFELQPLSEAVIRAYEVNGFIFRGAHPMGTVSFSVIAVLLLALACFNYMNISVSSSTRRLKEIGIRKVLGGTKHQLVRQFISENVVSCLLALLAGLLLAHFFFLPGFNHIILSHGIDMSLQIENTLATWLFLVALILIAGVGAGSYPAVYVSRFNPVNIFRGKLRLGGRNLIAYALLTLQFAFAFITIFSGISISRNTAFQKNQDWGYDQSQVIVIPIEGERDFKLLRKEIAENPNIVALGGSHNQIGRNSNSGLVKIAGEKYDVRRFRVGFNYVETMALRLQSGRSFSPQFQTDLEEAILVNESFVRTAGLDNPVGTAASVENRNCKIVGVVKDYHFKDFYQSITPAVIQMAPEEQFRYLSVRVKPGAVAETSVYLQETWKKLLPERLYLDFFQDSVFDSFYRQNEARSAIATFIAIIGLILSCMGLFGLAALSVDKRMKEFSIRKVLGARAGHVISLLNREFVPVIVVALVIATPLSYFLIESMLEMRFAYRMELGIAPFLIAAVCLIATAFLTISSQILRVLRENPIDALRSE